ncbi:MAG: Verru_Chthon cassette protein D [Verrucomicrobiota bacterium]
MKASRFPSGPRAGFTLIELLVVMGIISILIVLSAAALRSITAAGDLDSVADNMKSSMELARQEAMTQNRETEFRLYVDRETVGGTSRDKLVAYQTVIVGNTGSGVPVNQQQPNIQISQVQPLPASVDAMTSQSTMMPVGGENRDPFTDGWVEPGGNYYYIRFSPNGSAESPSGGGRWTLTLVNAEHADKPNTTDINFATLELQPLTGRIRIERPEAE